MAETDMMPTGEAGDSGPDPVGTRLQQAREAAGLSLAQLSQVTKIPMRVLVLIENGDFAALPSRTYATGFTRTYARALGLDEASYVDAVRAELGMASRVEAPPPPAFEPGDPARVPTARLAWLAALAAVAVIVAGLFFWRSYFAPAMSLPSLLPPEQATAEAAPPPSAPPQTILPDPFATASGLPDELATATAAPAEVRTSRRPQRPRRMPGGPAEARLGGVLPPGLPETAPRGGEGPAGASTGTP